MTQVLAGDIGGTKTILRLADAASDGSLTTLYEQRYPSSDYETLAPMVKQFIQEAAQSRQADLRSACFALAGPVVEQTAQLTNLPWTLSAVKLQSDLGIPTVKLINDFSAIGYGVLNLPDTDLRILQAGEPQTQAPVAVLGAGTGLGETYLTWDGQQYQVHASEGGHSDFPARSDLEAELLSYLRRKIGGRVSVERVVSGQGIVSIFQFLQQTQSFEATPLVKSVNEWESGANPTLDPGAAISEAASTGTDPIALKTMEMFVSAYGAEAGNLGLKLLPYGGLYVAGGIAAKILPLLEQGEFMKAFLDKGRLSSVLTSVPVQVVLNPQVGLIGATAYAARAV